METMETRLRLTPQALRAAAAQLHPGSSLRITFAGGCGAFGFRVGAARRPYPGDHVVDIDGLRVCLDARATKDLAGATIDFDPDEGFVIDHPLSGRTC